MPKKRALEQDAASAANAANAANVHIVNANARPKKMRKLKPGSGVTCKKCNLGIPTSRVKKEAEQHVIECCRNDQPDATDTYLLRIDSRFPKGFLLYVVAPREATFNDLKKMLIRTWMNCGCGHLSQFIVKVPVDDEYLPWIEEREVRICGTALGNDDRHPMSTLLCQVLDDIPNLEYEYDMGSTSTCLIRVVEDHFQAPADVDKPVIVMRDNLLRRSPRKGWCARLSITRLYEYGHQGPEVVEELSSESDEDYFDNYGDSDDEEF